MLQRSLIFTGISAEQELFNWLDPGYLPDYCCTGIATKNREIRGTRVVQGMDPVNPSPGQSGTGNYSRGSWESAGPVSVVQKIDPEN
jgi:hypothetical protein